MLSASQNVYFGSRDFPVLENDLTKRRFALAPVMFSIKACDDDDLVVRRVLDGTEGELDPSSLGFEESFVDEELLSFVPDAPPTTTSCTSRSSTMCSGKPLRKWIMLVMALLMMLPVPLEAFETPTNRSLRNTDQGSQEVLYTDFSSEKYRKAVAEALDAQKTEKYSHLTDAQFAKLRSLVYRRAEALYIEGSAPSTMLNYKFDIELLPGADPVKQKMPKYSLAQAEKEKYHVQKHEQLEQLRTPTDAQCSGWVTKSHIVHKSDDPNGRWIMDFRPLNASTKPLPIIIDDCGHVVRELAAKAWKSVFDAFAGFNQMDATERARELLTIATSRGLRQWCQKWPCLLPECDARKFQGL